MEIFNPHLKHAIERKIFIIKLETVHFYTINSYDEKLLSAYFKSLLKVIDATQLIISLTFQFQQHE